VQEVEWHRCVGRCPTRAGWVDASPPCPSVRTEVWVRWVPILTGCDHDRGGLDLRYGLSYRDVEKLFAERDIQVDHVSVYRWVQRFNPLLIDAARPRRHAPGDRWFVDETYVKVAGRWVYLYRAIDQFGQVSDVFVSERRDLGGWCFRVAVTL
jgi:hypothetical protein